MQIVPAGIPFGAWEQRRERRGRDTLLDRRLLKISTLTFAAHPG